MIKEKDDKLTKENELDLGYKIQAMKKLKSRMKSGYDSLTEEDDRVLKEGKEALEILVSNYYNLARKIAHEYHKKTGTRYSIDDLLQDAISALVEAAYKYDPSKNCRLSTYAYYGITKKVSTTINYQRLVRMPENKMGEYIEISKAQAEYNDLTDSEKEKYDSELDYVYKNVELRKEEVDLILSNMQPQVSLNADINEGDGELMDLIVDEKAEEEITQHSELDDSIVKIIAKLNNYETDLIAYEFGAFPASIPYSEFQKKYNLTDKKVKSETRRVIRKMKRIAEQVDK